jgi:predicted nucleic acid-binding protein
MRVLLDTNILIHREGRVVVRGDIGPLFHWLDQLKYEKCVHPASLDEIRKHADPETVSTLLAKLSSYTPLKTLSRDTPAVAGLRQRDGSENDERDTSLLAEVASERVDLLLTEDRGIHRKATLLGIADRVDTIDTFLERVTAEHPELVDYEVLSVRTEYFGNVDVADPFFDSFREEYPGFDKWFQSKADEVAYLCTAEESRVIAFLYVKPEGRDEDYSDIMPIFHPARRLKIGTFKVRLNGYKLGERFLKIAFDNALSHAVDEVYVTLFRKTDEQERLVRLLEEWGFALHGRKTTAAGTEEVYVRDFRPRVDLEDPRRTYPFVSRRARKFIVPIRPEYHTELLPDSILTTESPANYVENRPNRNAISKIYISRSIERGLGRGDVIVFYRTKSGGAGHHTSVATTLGVVQDVVTGIRDRATFVRLCRKRSVFSDDELAKQWDWDPIHHPFVVNFLYLQSFPTPRPNLRKLKEEGILSDAPRGFQRLADPAFERLMEVARADDRVVVG